MNKREIVKKLVAAGHEDLARELLLVKADSHYTPDQIARMKHSPEEIKKLPEMNASNLDSIFKVGNIVFDQRYGIGAVPENEDITYFGFVGMMLPKDFTLFTKRAEFGSTSPQELLKLLRDNYAVASPSLEINIDTLEILGNDGQARSQAIAKLQPNIPIPVHFFIYVKRAHHVTPWIVSRLNTHIKQQESDEVVSNKLRGIWLNNKYIPL